MIFIKFVWEMNFYKKRDGYIFVVRFWLKNLFVKVYMIVYIVELNMICNLLK